MLGTAIESSRPVIDGKRHTLTIDLPKEPLCLEADSVRLAQVFSNLLTNAAKYTEPGGAITLSAARDVRGVVELHGGRVEARSEGTVRGSEFVVRLPMGTPAERHSNDILADGDSSSALRILVVDDNRDVPDSCSALLELSGHRVRTAYAGQHVLELGPSFLPDVLVLVDIGLPDIDGYQLAQEVRKSAWGRGSTLIR